MKTSLASLSTFLLVLIPGTILGTILYNVLVVVKNHSQGAEKIVLGYFSLYKTLIVIIGLVAAITIGIAITHIIEKKGELI